MPSQSVLVIGGGLAGLSSAVALADAGLEVRLLEKRPHLGGRATSYTLPDGDEVDNCQHVTLGCCTNLADFYRRVGASEKIRFYDTLYFADRSGRRSAIRAWPLPPPLHLAPSFAWFNGLTMADKRGIARALLTVARAGGHPDGAEGLTMLEWLHRVGQTAGAIESFWRVVVVSALDEELAAVDARYGIDVFWKAFLASRTGYRLGIPSVPLGDLYGGCRDAIARRGGSVSLRAGVRALQVCDGKFRCAELQDGTEISADICIAAVTHDALLGLLSKEWTDGNGPLAGLHRLKTSPITGAHLWFDRPVMTEPYLTLLGHTTQWIFNKWMLYAERNETGMSDPAAEAGNGAKGKGQYLQLVISASYDLVARSRQEIIELCRRELLDVLPATRNAKLVKATVVKEINATVSPEPNADQWRPRQDVGIKNLYLAGDWTKTGWPSTMEGAVRSGYLAAEAALATLGRPQRFLQPDLPYDGLSSMWAKRRKTTAE